MNDFAGLSSLFLSQITDPFRIGLVAALIYTTFRNAAATGFVLPLVAGIMFVAYIIAVTFPAASQSMWAITGVGLVSNSVLAAVMLAIGFIWRKSRP